MIDFIYRNNIFRTKRAYYLWISKPCMVGSIADTNVVTDFQCQLIERKVCLEIFFSCYIILNSYYF